MNGKNQKNTGNGTWRFVRENALAILSLLVVIANLWIASKLNPIEQDITQLIGTVNAMQTQVDKIVPRHEIEVQLGDIKTQLNRMEGTLDSHLDRD